jgi:DNA-binding NarL/FixJ family response regulator
MSARIRIVISDAYKLVVDGLHVALETEPDMQVVASATDSEQLFHAVKHKAPDVAIVGLDLNSRSWLSSLERIRAEQLTVRVLALSYTGDSAALRAAIEAGADGYALKTEPAQHVLFAVRQVHRGQLIFPAGAKHWLLRRPVSPDSTAVTDRELAVLALVADGLSNAGIGKRLHVSENTIKFHLRNLYQKLGTRNRMEAARWYLREHGVTL